MSKIHMISRLIIFCSVLIFASLIQPLNLYAISASSISETKGSVAGGNEVIIKGDGFYGNVSGKVKNIVAFDSSCHLNNYGDIGMSYSTSSDNKLILTESGQLFDLSQDGSLSNLSEELGIENVEAIFYSLLSPCQRFIQSENGEVYIVLVDGLNNSIKISEPYIDLVDNKIKYTLDDSGIFMTEKGDIYATFYYDIGLGFINSVNDGKITDYKNTIATSESGKKYCISADYLGPDGKWASISDVSYSEITGDDIIYSSEDRYEIFGVMNDEYDFVAVYSSGKVIKYKQGEIVSEDTRLQDLLGGKYIQSTENSMFISGNDAYIYNSGIDKYSKLEGHSITSAGDENIISVFTYYNNDSQILLAYMDSGNLYRQDYIYNEENDSLTYTYELIGRVGGGEEATNIPCGTNSTCVITEKGTVTKINLETLSIEDITNEVSKGLPEEYSSIISSVYFGDIRVTNFEVIDNNTIKVIVPSGVNGDYEINLVDIRSGISAKTGLIYTYIDDSNNDNTKELEEPEDIVAPNTGYKK